jgi:predicted DNA-binding protein (MmcQ/YjbR family)
VGEACFVKSKFKSFPPHPAESALRKFALGFPGATEAFPWGNRAIKVRGKAFVFMGGEEGSISVGTKLPVSRTAALKMRYASPTHYGLGRHGWVTCEFGPKEKVPLARLFRYITESYEAIAHPQRSGSRTQQRCRPRAINPMGPI